MEKLMSLFYANFATNGAIPGAKSLAFSNLPMFKFAYVWYLVSVQAQVWFTLNNAVIYIG